MNLLGRFQYWLTGPSFFPLLQPIFSKWLWARCHLLAARSTSYNLLHYLKVYWQDGAERASMAMARCRCVGPARHLLGLALWHGTSDRCPVCFFPGCQRLPLLGDDQLGMEDVYFCSGRIALCTYLSVWGGFYSSGGAFLCPLWCMVSEFLSFAFFNLHTSDCFQKSRRLPCHVAGELLVSVFSMLIFHVLFQHTTFLALLVLVVICAFNFKNCWRLGHN